MTDIQTSKSKNGIHDYVALGLAPYLLKKFDASEFSGQPVLASERTHEYFKECFRTFYKEHCNHTLEKYPSDDIVAKAESDIIRPTQPSLFDLFELFCEHVAWSLAFYMFRKVTVKSVHLLRASSTEWITIVHPLEVDMRTPQWEMLPMKHTALGVWSIQREQKLITPEELQIFSRSAP